MEKSHNINTALYTACRHQASVEVVSKLLEVAERPHYTLHVKKTSIEVNSTLIEVGGRELFMKKCGMKEVVKYTAPINKSSMKVVSKFMEVGGRDLVRVEKDLSGDITSYIACAKNGSIWAALELIEAVDRDHVIQKVRCSCPDDQTALHVVCANKNLQLTLFRS